MVETIGNFKEQAFLSIVLYSHNDENLIEDTLIKLRNFTHNKFINYEIIVVDDNSLDKTVEKINNFCKNNNQEITLIELKYKHGVEKAIQSGIDFSIGDYVIEIDKANLAFEPEILWDLYLKSAKGNDIVFLTPDYQNLTTKLFYDFFGINHQLKLNLRTDSAIILTRRAINTSSLVKDKTRFRKLLYRMIGYKNDILEYRPLKKLKSNYTFIEKFKLASDIMFYYTNLGIKINLFLSLLFFMVSLSLGIYSVIVFLTFNKVIEGWTTLMLFLSFGFSGLFVVFAVFCKYMDLLLREIKTFPNYVIKKMDKVN